MDGNPDTNNNDPSKLAIEQNVIVVKEIVSRTFRNAFLYQLKNIYFWNKIQAKLSIRFSWIFISRICRSWDRLQWQLGCVGSDTCHAMGNRPHIEVWWRPYKTNSVRMFGRRTICICSSNWTRFSRTGFLSRYNFYCSYLCFRHCLTMQ